MYKWFDILKIKTPDGKMMVVENIKEYHDKFRIYMRPIVLPELRVTSKRITEKTKINIKSYPTPNGLRYNASWRDANDKKNYSLEFNYRGSGNETEPHELISVFSNNLGPSLILGTNYESDDAFDLLLEIRERVAEFLAPEQKTETMGIPSVEEDEERVSSEQYNRSLEEENPGFRMVEEQMRDLGDMKRLARRKGITLDQLLQRHNLTVEDFMIDVPSERNTPAPPPPSPEVSDGGAQKRENLKQRRNQLKPRRGKRGRKE